MGDGGPDGLYVVSGEPEGQRWNFGEWVLGQSVVDCGFGVEGGGREEVGRGH